MQNSYFRFVVMIATSTLVMFVLMSLNAYVPEHVFFSEPPAYMALYMGTILLFGVSLRLLRSQQTVRDLYWMKAMIPHHSIAVLTSERADLSDPRVQSLAQDIIEAQQLKIDEMKALIAELEDGPAAPQEVDGK
jgi:hypothetical protein